jgi:hypothetical protein
MKQTKALRKGNIEKCFIMIKMKIKLQNLKSHKIKYKLFIIQQEIIIPVKCKSLQHLNKKTNVGQLEKVKKLGLW